MTSFVIQILFLALSVALGMPDQQDNFRLMTSKEEVIAERLHSAPKKNKERAQKIEELFRQAHCPQLELQKVSGSGQPNVICTVKGQSDSVIVVGAHFDKVDEGEGIVDNWSGASLLPSLLESVTADPRQHTYAFIAFTGEEEGMVGSQYYLKKLPKEQLAKIRGMVNMDTLGLGPTEVWASHSDKEMLDPLARIASAMKLPIKVMNVEAVGSSDSESFAAKKIPRTTLHSLTSETLPILHSYRDTAKEMRMSDYYQSCRLIAAYVVYLDSALK